MRKNGAEQICMKERKTNQGVWEKRQREHNKCAKEREWGEEWMRVRRETEWMCERVKKKFR